MSIEVVHIVVANLIMAWVHMNRWSWAWSHIELQVLEVLLSSSKVYHLYGVLQQSCPVGLQRKWDKNNWIFSVAASLTLLLYLKQCVLNELAVLGLIQNKMCALMVQTSLFLPQPGPTALLGWHCPPVGVQQLESNLANALAPPNFTASLGWTINQNCF